MTKEQSDAIKVLIDQADNAAENLREYLGDTSIFGDVEARFDLQTREGRIECRANIASMIDPQKSFIGPDEILDLVNLIGALHHAHDVMRDNPPLPSFIGGVPDGSEFDESEIAKRVNPVHAIAEKGKE